MHGVGTTVSVSPLEPGQIEHGGQDIRQDKQEAGQTFLATQRGVCRYTTLPVTDSCRCKQVVFTRSFLATAQVGRSKATTGSGMR
jgi:hypothetical protein